MHFIIIIIVMEYNVNTYLYHIKRSYQNFAFWLLDLFGLWPSYSVNLHVIFSNLN